MSVRLIIIARQAVGGAVIYGLALMIAFPLTITCLNPVLIHANWDVGSLLYQSLIALVVGAFLGGIIGGVRAFVRQQSHPGINRDRIEDGIVRNQD